MPQQSEPPRPHGDPLEKVVDNNPEENRAQRDSDSSPDANTEGIGGERANKDDGSLRRKQYEGGAELVSEID
jgi:hypothetical protein